MTIRYLSVCSGIEAASVAWEPLGWTPAAFAEIDAFPSAVLAHRFPHVPNLGDFTRITTADVGPIELLVGGTPCQDLSVAGKRAGLAGERSGLFRNFVECADRFKPRYIVWENVPGALSTNDGKDIQEVIDSFTQIGYACDIDILDAQEFGLAQRRRRVFVVCVRLDDLLRQKTPISERIAAELLLQPLVDTWAAILQASYPGRSPSGYVSPIELSASSAKRKIELLEKALDGSACIKLLNALGANQAPVTGELGISGSISVQHCAKQAAASKMDIGGFPLWSVGGASGDKSTDTSWNSILAALSDRKSGSTTSISTDRTTLCQICSFADQSLRIARFITDSKSCSDQPKWSSDYWNLASLLLTTLEVITEYARQATNDLFGEPSLRNDWGNHLDQARDIARDAQRNLGARPSPSALFSIPHSLQGHSPPRREAGQRAAPTLAARTRGGGGLGRDFDCDGGLIADCWPATVAPTLNAHFGDKQGLEDQHALAGAGLFVPHTSHSLRGEGFDASEDGTGRGTPIVPIAYRTSGNCGAWETGDKVDALTTGTDPNHHVLAFSSKDHGADAGDIAPTLRAMGHSGSHANAGGQLAVAFAENSRAELRLEGGDGSVAGSLKTGGGKPGQSYPVAQVGMQVRRLTPRECERLQGFPDDWTLVPYRGKPAADGPRYKALGNSFAVPVVRWIGERIAAINRRSA